MPAHRAAGGGEPARGRRPPRRAATPSPHRGGPPFRDVTLVAAGGAIGALARVALAAAFPVRDGAYPWITFTENLIGAFLLGLVLTLLAERVTADRRLRLLVCTGTLGAFTTYSAFAHELSGRLLDGRLLLVTLYTTASLVGGLAVGFVGIRTARAWPWVPDRVRDRRRGGRDG